MSSEPPFLALSGSTRRIKMQDKKFIISCSTIEEIASYGRFPTA
jgi:hypothetical protein